MTSVTVTAGYRIVIPKTIRVALCLEPGMKLQAFVTGNQVTLIPIRPIESMRGFLSGIDTTVDRRDDETRLVGLAE